mgnify:CR=1 FL=1
MPTPVDPTPVHHRPPGWFTRRVLNGIVAWSTRRGLSIWGSRVLEVRGAWGRVDAANAQYNQMRAEIDHIIEAGTKKRACEEARPRLDEAEELQVVLGTPTAAPPAWLAHAHPELMLVDAQGL